MVILKISILKIESDSFGIFSKSTKMLLCFILICILYFVMDVCVCVSTDWWWKESAPTAWLFLALWSLFLPHTVERLIIITISSNTIMVCGGYSYRRLGQNLGQSRQRRTGCICLTFLRCAFSNKSSNCLHEPRQSHTGYWLHLYDFSPLCVFKCLLKLPA